MSQNTLLERSAPEQSTPEQQSAVAVTARGAAQQITIRNIGLIVKQEYKKRLTQRSFTSAPLSFCLIVIAAFVPTITRFVAHSNSQTRITVVNNAGSIGGLNGDTLTSYINMALNGTTGASPGSVRPGKRILSFRWHLPEILTA